MTQSESRALDGPPSKASKTALVLGATGGIGGAIAQVLLRHGWVVRGMARDPVAAAKRQPGLDWVGGDAMQRRDVVEAAEGVSTIVHAVNPPSYQNWDKLVLPMIDNTIAAARNADARILLPGTIYNFDPAATPFITASSPQHPRSRKGAIRVALERRLQIAAPEVRSVVLRAGDFFGPGARSSWFSQAMVKPGQPLRRVVTMTRSGGHSWAYLPDLAETAARVLEAEDRLEAFDSLQFEGFHDEDGTSMIEAIRRAAGMPLSAAPFPWWAMHLMAPFGGFPREASEIAPYWRHPVKLVNSRLVEIIGPEPGTGIDAAVRTTLVGLGCLPQLLRQARHIGI